LSTSELAHIRDVLAGGRRPKVVFTEAAGQIVGQQGQVVELTDPAVSEEWVVVRFGRDELPFSPTDLAIAPRGAPARRPAVRATSAATQVAGPPLLPPAAPAKPAAVKPADVEPAAVPAPREEKTVTRPATTKAAPVNGKPVAAGAPGDASPHAASGGGGGGKDQPARSPAKAAARAPARGKPPASLTVTLCYTGGAWMVAAQQGSRSLAKPYVIRAAEALRMVGMLDVPGVHDAVEEIVACARAEAEAAADKLRAELAEVEARLAELREAR
jgi:hypothetical protein